MRRRENSGGRTKYIGSNDVFGSVENRIKHEDNGRERIFPYVISFSWHYLVILCLNKARLSFFLKQHHYRCSPYNFSLLWYSSSEDNGRERSFPYSILSC
jgi:hypothetical protein